MRYFDSTTDHNTLRNAIVNQWLIGNIPSENIIRKACNIKNEQMEIV